jgi:hypothetical protein
LDVLVSRSRQSNFDSFMIKSKKVNLKISRPKCVLSMKWGGKASMDQDRGNSSLKLKPQKPDGLVFSELIESD